MDITPIYYPDNGWGNHFSSDDINYIVNVTSAIDTEFYYLYNNINGFIVKPNDGNGYKPFQIYSFLQTFKMNDIIIGSQIFNVTIEFGDFINLQINGEYVTPPAIIPSVGITLSKQVQKNK